MLFLLMAKPLLDLAYFPIQLGVIDILSKKENRSEFAYILNHEAGLYAGRFLGAATFILLAWYFSEEFALRYAIMIVAIIQLGSVLVAKFLLREGRSEEHTSELQSLMRISYAVYCFTKNIYY